MAYLSLDGTTSSATTPDAAALKVTGDLDLRVRAALPDWTPPAGNCLLAKRTFTNSGAYSLLFGSGSGGRFTLRLDWSSDGSTFTQALATANLPFANDTVAWVRATLDVDNGASGYDVKFYYSSEDLADSTSVSWTQLGTTITGGATTSIASTNNIVSVGALGDGITWEVTGNIYRAQIYDGIAGTKVFDPDFSDPTTWAENRTVVVEKANAADVTLQGDASLVGGGFPLQLLGVA